MRDFTTQPWQTTLTRWGDAVFGLALLLTDDRAAAEQATVRAFTQSFAAGSDLSEDALFRALIQQRSGRFQRYALIPRRWQRHALPEPLTRIAAFDRVLLALWLLHGIDHVRLAAIAQMELAALHKKLAAALLRTTAKTGAVEEGMVNAVAAWLSQIPAGHAGKLAQFQSAENDATREWTAALETTRTTLRTAVGHRRLPLHCADEIAAEAYAQVDGAAQWWQRRSTWIGAIVAMVGVVLLLLIKPWSSGVPASATQPPTPAEIVQQTIDAWTNLPTSGTVHRRVWAKPVLTTGDEPLITDVWLAAASDQHRVEVRRKETLVEWQVADGRRRFEYAGQPFLSSCQWADSIALDRRARSFSISSAEIAAARDARLTLGAYGLGYQILQQALAAKDLRSFGSRVEGDTVLMALSYTDTTGLYQRRMLVWIDTKAKELKLVQELTGAKDGAAGRDVWRLQLREEVAKGMPLETPDWLPPIQQRNQLLDPACPGLDASHVVSLRTTLTRPIWWNQLFLPTALPDDINRAALLSATPFVSQRTDPNNINTVFAGPGRWLQLKSTGHTTRDLHRGETSGDWIISIDEQAQLLSGSACRTQPDTDVCFPSVGFTAYGWTNDEIQTMIASLKPIDVELWQKYDAMFLDPQPLSVEVKDILGRAWEAQRPKGEALHLTADWSARDETQRHVLEDPYHVQLHIQFPEYLHQEQWLAYSDTHVLQYKNTMTLLRGELYSSQSNDGVRMSNYDASMGVAHHGRQGSINWGFDPPQTPADHMIKHFFRSSATINIDILDGAIRLSQIQQTDARPSAEDMMPTEIDLFVGPLTPWISDLRTGSYKYEVWLNDVTYLPMEAVNSFIDQQGQETKLTSGRLVDWKHRPSIPSYVWAEPNLPEETIIFDDTSVDDIHTFDTAGNLFAMERVLVWPDTADLKQMFDNNPVNVDQDPRVRSRLSQAITTPLQQLDQLDLIKMTTYVSSDETNRLVVRQGPRLLLRHVLRHHPLFVEPRIDRMRGNIWATSASIPVTIEGQQLTAWLLEDNADVVALVVEVDDVLLHISGADRTYLKQQVPAMLSQMVWADLPE